MAVNEPAAGDGIDEAPGAGPGATLRDARVARGISVEEISTDLRIEQRLLHAIENDDFRTLGAPVFAKGYIRQYASRLGLEAVPLVEQYTAAMGHADVHVQPSRAIRLRDSQQVTIWIVALIALAVVVFLLAWWFNVPGRLVSGDSVGRAVPASMPFPEAGTAEPRTPPSPAGVAARPEPAPANAGAQRAPAANGPSPSADEAAAAAAPPAAVDSAGTVAGPLVELVFVDDCWTEITGADGEQLLFGLIEAGARHRLAGAAPFDVFLGNAAAVEIRVDGRDFTVPGTARRGNLARFAIDAATN